MYNEEMLKKSQLKEELLRIGLQEVMTDKKHDIDYIQRCFELLRDEQSTQKYLIETIEKEKSGEAQKKENAKKLLGIGG